MKVKFGSIVTAGSGKIGGHVVSGSLGGRVLKTKGLNYSKGKNFGILFQGKMSRFSSKWRTMSVAQRDSWEKAASSIVISDNFGDKMHLSGYNLYIKHNIYASITGFDPVLVYKPSIIVSVGNITDLTIGISVSQGVLNFSSTNLVTYRVILYLTPAMSPSVKINDKDYLFEQYVPVAGLPTFFDLKNPLYTSGMTTDSAAYYKCVVVDDYGNTQFIGSGRITFIP